MVLNGVSFNVDLCLKMSKEEFVKAHLDACYLDRDKKDRRKILEDAYSMMVNELSNNMGAF